MNKEHKKRWNTCPGCHQMIFTTGYGTGNHRCPDKIKARVEAELDMAVDEELSTWDADLKKFWRSKDVKFYRYLADEGRL